MIKSVDNGIDFKKAHCEDMGGVWKNFGNGCADSCRKHEEEMVMCTMAFVWACDCGEGKCYDSEARACRDIRKTAN